MRSKGKLVSARTACRRPSARRASETRSNIFSWFWRKFRRFPGSVVQVCTDCVGAKSRNRSRSDRPGLRDRNAERVAHFADSRCSFRERAWHSLRVPVRSSNRLDREPQRRPRGPVLRVRSGVLAFRASRPGRTVPRGSAEPSVRGAGSARWKGWCGEAPPGKERQRAALRWADTELNTEWHGAVGSGHRTLGPLGNRDANGR